MRRHGAISVLFAVAAVYDGILGLAFAVLPRLVFETCGVTPPNHFGYVRFPGLLLLVFAALFAAVARAPRENRNLIPYGAGLKASYCALVFWYWATSDIPWMWKPFAIVDLVFLALFVVAYRRLGSLAGEPPRP